MRSLPLLLLIACHDPVEPSAVIEAVVLQSDYVSGLISHGENSLPVDGDSALRVFDEGIAVLQRGEGDNLLWLDHELNPKGQWLLPEGSNPQDVIATERGLLVSLYARPELLLLSTTNGQVLERIDISDQTDEDGKPEASSMLNLGDGRVIIAVQNLDFQGLEPIPPPSSRLLIIDIASASVAGELSICANPFGPLHKGPDGRLMMACNGDWSVQADAGLVAVDMESGEHELLVSEEDLGGNLLDLHPADGGWLLVVADASFEQTLRRFDPESGLGSPLPSPTRAIGCIGRVGDQLWVCDRQVGAHGLRRILPGDEGVDEVLEPTPLPPVGIAAPAQSN